jgi:HK97 family phage major capsid protein
MEYELAVDNALDGKLGYIFHPCIRRNLLKKKIPNYSGQTDGTYILNPATEGDFKNWLGYPYAMSTQIPINLTKADGTALTEVYFANWEELLIANWGGMEIMASQETSDAFEKDMTWVRILQEVDIAVRHAASFCLINDASSAS